MKYLNIQIQPERNNSIDESIVIEYLKENGYAPEVAEGNDSGKYININVKTNNLKALWVRIKIYLENNNNLYQSSIITCEGNQGWDDYFLLHHYDTNEKTDAI